MSPRNKVPTLKRLCLNTAHRNLHDILSKMLTQYPLSSIKTELERYCWKEVASYYQESLLPEFLNRLLLDFTIENYRKETPQNRYAALKLLMNSNTVELSFESLTCDEEYQIAVMELLSEENHIRLKKLDFGIFCHLETNIMSEFLVKNIWTKNLSNLKILSIPYCCNDQILAVIGRNCLNLTGLYIYSSNSVTDQGIFALCFSSTKERNVCCMTLVKIRLDIINLSTKSIAMLINNMPLLTTVGNYDDTGEALMYEYSSNACETKLTCFSTQELDFRILEVIVKRCPNLTDIIFKRTEEGVLQYLHHLRNITTLSICDVSAEHLVEYVKRHSKLKVLSATDILGELNVSVLLHHSPNLEELTISSDNRIIWPYGPIMLRTLKFSANFCDSDLKEILINCINVEKLEIYDCEMLHDEDIEYILPRNSFSKLRVFDISDVPYLTSHSVWMLINKLS